MGVTRSHQGFLAGSQAAIPVFGFGTGLDAKLAIDTGQVGLDRFDRDAESLADLAIARALDNQA